MPLSLFGLTEYDTLTTEFMLTTINDLMRRTDSVLNEMPFHEVQDLPKTQVTTRTGEVVKTETLNCHMEFSVALSDSIAGCIEGFTTSMNAAAESGLQSLMPQVFRAISQVCEATGNTVNAEDKGLTPEVFLQMLKNLDIHFDEDGNHNLKWVMHPSTFEELSKLPPLTEKQQRAIDELLERKRREFNANRRHRKLIEIPAESK